MSKVTITVCDMCEGLEPLTGPYHVETGDVELDLCPTHAQLWKSLQASSNPKAKAASPRTRKPSRQAGKEKETSSRGARAKRPVRKSGRTTKAAAAKAKKNTTPPKNSRKAAARPAVDNSAVRAWARSNGIAVTARGPLKTELIEQFLAAPVNDLKPRGSRRPEATFSHQQD